MNLVSRNRRTGWAALVAALVLTAGALAGFCPRCGNEHVEQDRFCTRCGAKLGASLPAPGQAEAGSPATGTVPTDRPAAVAASPGPETSRRQEETLAPKLELDDIRTDNPGDGLALEFLKALVQGKPYLGSASAEHIQASPGIREIEMVSKRVEVSRPPQAKYLYDMRIRVRKEVEEASWFGKRTTDVWEHWCLRVQKRPDRILSWVPKSYYDNPFVRRPDADAPLPAPAVFAQLGRWMVQRARTDRTLRAEDDQPILSEYAEVQADGTMSIERAFPFVRGGNVVTSLLHLAGTEIGGQRLPLVAFRISNHLARRLDLRVRAQLQGMTHEAVDSVTIEPGATGTIGLTPILKPDALALTGKLPSAIHVLVAAEDGRTLYEATERVDLLPKFDFVLDQKLLPFIAAFVTPTDRLVDQLVIAAAKRVSGGSMAGYQKPRQGVIEEIRAIYDTIAGLGVRYRSNTTSFLRDDRIVAQRITLPADSLAGMGANCIDGAVLFASCFEALGLEASIVFGPGHAFVAVIPDRAQREILCVETTMVGSAPFDEAVVSAGATYTQWQKERSLQVIDLPKARAVGISPFPYPSDHPLVADRLRQLASR